MPFWERVDRIMAHLDRLFGKAMSRKFIAFAIATHMAYIDILQPEHWFWIACIFMGVQGAVDAVEKFKKSEGPEV